MLVTIDTLRADQLGCYGAARTRTPGLDALAARGVRFEVAVSPAPLTLPAHASLMTALDPPSHGVRHNSIHRLAPDLPTLAERMRQAGYATAAFVGAVVLQRRFGLDRGFERYDDAVGSRRSGTVGFAERPADAVVDAALAWLAQAPDRFFLWIHLYDPHRAYDPPPGFAAAFARDPYAGEIAFADSQVGRLLAAIEARWGAAGLLVAATSDHGESRGEHGEATHAYTVYDATQRIPLILSGPGLPAGAVVRTPVRLVDVAPTLLALAGAPPLRSVDGRDLRAAIEGRERGPRLAYVETLATQIDFGWSPLLGIRSERFKYIRAPEPELYDLIADPGETRNLAAGEPEQAARLDAALEARLARVRPPEPAAGLAPQEREALRSLGYLTDAPGADLELGRVGGPDPKRRLALLAGLGEAELRLARGEAREALALLAEFDESGPQVEALRAAAAVTAGEAAAAERAARAVLAADPGRGDMWVVLGRALADQDRPAEARQAFETALALDASAHEARERLDALADATSSGAP